MLRIAILDDLETLVEGNLRLAFETESLELDAEVVRRGVKALLEQRGRSGSLEVLLRRRAPARTSRLKEPNRDLLTRSHAK